MKLKPYFVTSDFCGHCDIALKSLEGIYGDSWKDIMETITTSHEISRANNVTSTPTLLVVDLEDDNNLVAQVAGSNNLNEEFWSKFFKKV